MRTMRGLRHKASSGDRPQHQVVVTAQRHRSIPFHRDWHGGPQALSRKHVPLACTTLRKQCTCQTFGSWEVACKTDLIACAGKREDPPSVRRTAALARPSALPRPIHRRTTNSFQGCPPAPRRPRGHCRVRERVRPSPSAPQTPDPEGRGGNQRGPTACPEQPAPLASRLGPAPSVGGQPCEGSEAYPHGPHSPGPEHARRLRGTQGAGAQGRSCAPASGPFNLRGMARDPAQRKWRHAPFRCRLRLPRPPASGLCPDIAEWIRNAAAASAWFPGQPSGGVSGAGSAGQQGTAPGMRIEFLSRAAGSRGSLPTAASGLSAEALRGPQRVCVEVSKLKGPCWNCP